MYEKFYQLAKNPFDITPDPSFLIATRKHNEGLAALYYGVRRRKGFVVMTGEVGTGKTLLVRCLLHVLSRTDVVYAYVFNSRLNDMEFLQYIAGDFGLPIRDRSKSELLLDLSSFLIGRYQKGLATVLVVDEAHHLSVEVLEEIRLLTNLETTQEKLLQILLVGQPELDQKLDSVDLRQLKQRIALRAHLSSLDLEETRDYIYRRLQLAGNPAPEELFPDEAVLEVYLQSQGFPRLINTLCENALVHGYAKQARSISPEIVAEIAADFRLNVTTPSADAGTRRNGYDADVVQAARVMLDLYAQLHRAPDRNAERMTTGAAHEPHI